MAIYDPTAGIARMIAMFQESDDPDLQRLVAENSTQFQALVVGVVGLSDSGIADLLTPVFTDDKAERRGRGARAADDGSPHKGLPPEAKAQLKARMGLPSGAPAIQRNSTGRKVSFAVMPPDEARLLAKRSR